MPHIYGSCIFVTQELDYEVELAFVMAKAGRNIKVQYNADRSQ